MDLDKLMDIMREREYTLELNYTFNYTSGVWEMIVWNSDGDEVASKKIKDGLLVKPAIVKAALDIVKQLT